MISSVCPLMLSVRYLQTQDHFKLFNSQLGFPYFRSYMRILLKELGVNCVSYFLQVFLSSELHLPQLLQNTKLRYVGQKSKESFCELYLDCHLLHQVQSILLVDPVKRKLIQDMASLQEDELLDLISPYIRKITLRKTSWGIPRLLEISLHISSLRKIII
jgi:hypothetical protein